MPLAPLAIFAPSPHTARHWRDLLDPAPHPDRPGGCPPGHRRLLAAPDGSSRKEQELPKGVREPDTAYRKRLHIARPSGFFRDVLRTYAGMLSRGSWISLPPSLSSVLTVVEGRGTDLGVVLAAADLHVLRDGAVLVLVLPPEHSWPSEGGRQEALRRGDRLSLPRLQRVPRANGLNWDLPVSCGLPFRQRQHAAKPRKTHAQLAALKIERLLHDFQSI